MNWTMPYPWRSRSDSVRRINMSSGPGNESFFCALRPIPRILSLRRRDCASQVQIGEPSRRKTISGNAPGFIIDWSQGPVSQPPQALRRYQVSFYSDELQNERPIYMVYICVGPGSDEGYVYLPGKSDEWWRLNVSSIVRGVEGKWFHAWSLWEGIARPLIKKARTTKFQ